MDLFEEFSEYKQTGVINTDYLYELSLLWGQRTGKETPPKHVLEQVVLDTLRGGRAAMATLNLQKWIITEMTYYQEMNM